MGQKVHKAGMGLSVTAITGLGGPELMEKHAVETAKAFNAMNPEYIGMLTLVVEHETPLEDWVKAGTFKLLTQEQVLEETRLLVENLGEHPAPVAGALVGLCEPHCPESGAEPIETPHCPKARRGRGAAGLGGTGGISAGKQFPTADAGRAGTGAAHRCLSRPAG